MTVFRHWTSVNTSNNLWEKIQTVRVRGWPQFNAWREIPDVNTGKKMEAKSSAFPDLKKKKMGCWGAQSSWSSQDRSPKREILHRERSRNLWRPPPLPCWGKLSTGQHMHVRDVSVPITSQGHTQEWEYGQKLVENQKGITSIEGWSQPPTKDHASNTQKA